MNNRIGWIHVLKLRSSSQPRENSVSLLRTLTSDFSQCLQPTNIGPDLREAKTVDEGIQTRVEVHKCPSELQDAMNEEIVSIKYYNQVNTKPRQVTDYKETVDPQHAGCCSSVLRHVLCVSFLLLSSDLYLMTMLMLKRNVLVFHRLKIMSPRHQVSYNKKGWIHVLKLRSLSQTFENSVSLLRTLATHFSQCLQNFGPDLREAKTVDEGIQT